MNYFQPKIIFGITASVATIYIYKNYDTLPSFNEVKQTFNLSYTNDYNKIDISNTSITTSQIQLDDISNNDHV